MNWPKCILILLGARPLSIIAKRHKYSDVVDNAKMLYVNGISTVVCPFPVGNGRSQKNFTQRMNNAANLIKELYRA